jgi:hypothetical protein
MITGRAQSKFWKLRIGAFGFLQTDDLWFGFREPSQKPILASPQRIDVPRNDPHSS